MRKEELYSLCTQMEVEGKFYYRVPYTYIRKEKSISQEGGWTMVLNSMFEAITNVTDFKVYCFLCSHWNAENGKAFPSVSYIAKKCCIAEKTVRNSISRLEKLGAIRKIKNKTDEGEWLNNTYEIYYFEVNEDKTIVKRMKALEDTCRGKNLKPIFNDQGYIIGLEDLEDSIEE